MKTRTIALLVVGACGALFVAGIASCAGVLFLAYRNTDAAISPVIDELFARVENDTFADTYETHTSAELRKTVAREQYRDIGLSFKNRLGPLKSKTMQQFNVRQANANRYADVAYAAVFEKGSGRITGRFKKEGDRWLVVSLQVNSPVFQQDLATGKCPHCGEPHTAGAKFCPKCGKALTDEPAAATLQTEPPADP
jgi:hypothetical protein